MVVGLLANSSYDFLITWLACLRLGLGVLFIACVDSFSSVSADVDSPQCSAEAVAHLLVETGATHLLYDKKHASLAKSSLDIGPFEGGAVELASDGIWRDFAEPLTLFASTLAPEQEADSLAIIFHTSGSTGMPKPIYQTHRVWTEALPRKPDRPAFTTTPLYHGGTADLMRAMMSDSMLYLFTPDKPITAMNIVESIHCTADVAFFLSVPYVLKLLYENLTSRQLLASFDMISVGGAPLPDELGNAMVDAKWKLVSRMGSSECGFLLSSWRDFGNDKEWSYLREDGSGMLNFVGEDDSTAELVVSKSWPTLNTSNRKDGSFSTGDLYKRHPSIHRAWRYHARADDIIVLLNGEKFGASHLESIFRADKHVEDALLCGADRPFSSALIFVATEFRHLADQDLFRLFQPTLEKLNRQCPSFAQLSPDMISIQRDTSRLPRSSKGTLQRAAAIKNFQQEIKDLYQRKAIAKGNGTYRTALTKVTIRQLLSEVTQQDLTGLDDETDLFAFGIQSVQAARLRRLLLDQSGFEEVRVPTNIVFELPTINELTTFFATHVEIAQSSCAKERLMLRLAEKYAGIKSKHCSAPFGHRQDLVVLTGATGALGAHVLRLVLRKGYAVVCLVRADTDEKALFRIRVSLEQRKIRADVDRVDVYGIDINKPDLGLKRHQVAQLRQASTFLHCAWPVNFSMQLQSFETQLAGLQALLTIAAHAAIAGPTTFVFCSSIASVLGAQPRSMIQETISTSPADCGTIGYSQSKWVAESICNSASLPNLRVAVARIGQLCGDTENGIWNTTEAWPHLFRSANLTGSLPNIDEDLSWLPVDIAAQTIYDIATSSAKFGSNAEFYHVYQPAGDTKWPDLLVWLDAAGLRFTTIPATAWLAKLKLAFSRAPDDPAAGLYSLWEKAYAKTSNPSVVSTPIQIENASAVSAAFRTYSGIDRVLVEKMIRHWHSIGFLR